MGIDYGEGKMNYELHELPEKYRKQVEQKIKRNEQTNVRGGITNQKENKTPSNRLKKGKYHNSITEVDGIKFDSAKEARIYMELKELERSGQIRDLKLQVPFTLQEGYEIDGKKVRPIKYYADFTYFLNSSNEYKVVDVKASASYQTDVYRLKKKIFEKVYGIKITEMY